MKSYRTPEQRRPASRTEQGGPPESVQAGPPSPEPILLGARGATQTPFTAAAPSIASELRRLAAADDVLGGSAIPTDVRSTLQQRRGSGSALPGAVSSGVARQLGLDLSDVRIHTDPEADRLAGSMQSVAFTQGSDIYFARGAYAPVTATGSQLLAHELAHVAQRSVGSSATIGRADDPVEAAADRTAARIAPDVRRLASAPGSVERAAEPAGAGAESGPMRRKIDVSPGQLEDARKEPGRKRKRPPNADTLDKIADLLFDKLGRWDDQEKELLALAAVEGLCNTWLKKHSRTKNAELKDLVTKIRTEAGRDRRATREQLRYRNDARAGTKRDSGKTGPYSDWGVLPTKTAFTQQIGQQADASYNIRNKAHDPSMPVDRTGHDPGAELRLLIRSVGLSEAEILAIRTFTDQDYKYINPARADDKAWLASQTPDVHEKLRDRHKKSADPEKMMDEGKRHAAMMELGLAKLPKKAGKVYRGERMTPAAFKLREAHFHGPPIVYPTFMSVSTKTSTPEGFANKSEKSDHTVSVFTELTVNNARDVKPISTLQMEDEWLLLPGATFAMTQIVNHPQGDAGTPTATAWKVIHLTQTT